MDFTIEELNKIQMNELMEMGMSEQRKTMAFDLLKELIKQHEGEITQTDRFYLVSNAISMTDDFLKKIEE